MKNNFCSSPWFHIRLTYDGNYNICRFSREENTNYNIVDHTLMDFYNSPEMCSIRAELLNGGSPKECASCYYEDRFNKTGGRKKQLLKSGITLDDDWHLQLRSSPHYNLFKHSYENSGQSDYSLVDLQIDLCNTCNSACIMCYPKASSRLEKDWQQLNKIEPQLFEKPTHYRSWTKNPQILDRFVNEISNLKNLRYIHFLGGETLYDQAFYKICDKLIEAGIAKNIIVGTTTNGTIYSEKLEQYIREFSEFHLGISIETVTPLNDYIRYPSKIDAVLENIKRFSALREQYNLFISLRITPTVFTISELDLMAQFMIDNNLTAESCNILTNPSMLRMELMPQNIREDIIAKLENIVVKYDLKHSNNINIRNKYKINETIANTILEYLQFLKEYNLPDNAEEERFKLVRWVKAFEIVHKNRITDYAPQYTEFLTHYGY
jgi:MoaA/NifB/PqqE/SkfB family radical SAM enzyme